VAHGTLHWRSVLDERDVQEIRKRVTLGEVQAEVARLFGVSSSVVSEISTGKAWERA
jgi:DNA-binding transcriptional regulator YiaG